VAAAIREALVASRARSYDPEAIRVHAAYFSEANFHERLHREVDDLLKPVNHSPPRTDPTDLPATG
ncbi:MAG: hypothetical protein ABIZ07_09430, partial [Dermatophilaceae bacterium]